MPSESRAGASGGDAAAQALGQLPQLGADRAALDHQRTDLEHLGQGGDAELGVVGRPRHRAEPARNSVFSDFDGSTLPENRGTGSSSVMLGAGVQRYR